MRGEVAVPDSWLRAPLGVICEVNPPRSPDHAGEKDHVVFVPMAAVNEENGGIDVGALRPFKEAQTGYTQFREGDVLLAKITPCMENGKVAVVPQLQSPLGYGSTELFVIRPTQAVSAAWVCRYLSQRKFRDDASRSMQGAAGQLRVPKKWLEAQEVPLPPTPEQHRIVAKLDELFSELDAGVSALERAQAKLARYRASVLKAAVEGRLTERWRREHPPAETGAELLERILVERRRRWEKEQLAAFEAKGRRPPRGWQDRYQEPAGPDTSGLPELPEGWCWAGLAQLGELGRGKSKHRPRGDPALYGGPYPFVQTGEVRASNGWIREFGSTYNEAGLRQSKLWPAGTLCITIAANIAETGILTFAACFPDSVVGLACGDAITTRFAEAFLRTARARLEQYAPATAQKNINLETLTALAVPLPPRDEQQEVMRLADVLLAAATGASSTIASSFARATHLRQSILSAAFQGRLVPQDPNDEPASVLLERIRAERGNERRTPMGRARAGRKPAARRKSKT